jgi:sugar lactone lactonase YvrE
MRRLVPATVLALGAAIVFGGSATGVAVAAPPTSTAATGHGAAAHQLFPKIIPVPNGFAPEGIAVGRNGQFYVGSTANGAIFRGSVVTGTGSVLVPGVTGLSAAGIEIAGNVIVVAGAATGTGHVYDARTGATLASYQFVAAGAGFVNDVAVLGNAAYFTDSTNQVLYVVQLGRHGRPSSTFRTLPLTGDIVFVAGFNANGIETTPDGRNLLVVQSNTGQLFSVAPRTGVATEVDLGGATLVNGDGLLRSGRVLYAVQNQNNQVAVVRLDRRGASGTVVNTITDPALDVPTTIGQFGPFLYAINARFGTPPGPDVTYTAVRLPAVRS